MESSSTSSIPHLVAIPYPGRGHVNPMLHLCRRLASRGIHVTFVLTREWLRLLSPSSTIPDNLRFLPIPDVLPSERHRGVDLPAFVRAVLTNMGEQVDELLGRLRPPADFVLADSLLPWAPEIGRRRGLPVAAIFPQAATELLALYELSNIEAGAGAASDLLNYIPKDLPYSPLDSSRGCIQSFTDSISWSFTAESLLFTSFYELESHAMDSLRSKIQIPVHPIGPSIPYNSPVLTHPYTKWLDSKPVNSILYVSLGSFLPVPTPQMEELALGLSASGSPFLWAVQEEHSRIQELIGDKDEGLIVSWCDQLSVLRHPSVGGFLSHCGWNSMLEAVHAGVPVIAFPLMWDQYPNSNIIVDDWGVGVRLRDGADDGGVVRREVVRVL
ncbi:UDP-glycosyltransferase 87A2-like [Typha angustifolia]|uniref:UDP-glycosyltransferase 87A2-like n=1 Tax=Typha angustifolia TaxID=59011 RepID=UPI003C3047AA